MSSGFKFDASGIFAGMKQFDKRYRAAITLYANTSGEMMESDAKMNGPWIDRTAQARNTIYSGTYWDGNRCFIHLSSGVEHMVYLELAMQKKYAILWPTIINNSADIMEGLAGLFSRM